MKREHPFLTGAEDSVFAVLLALSPDTEQAVVDQVEACYDALKHPFARGSIPRRSAMCWRWGGECPGET